MRAVLVNLAYPKIPWRFRQESLGLAYLAAVARRAGHDVDIIDASPRGWTSGRLVRLIMESDRGAAMSLVADLPRTGFAGHVVIGGHPPTFPYRELLHNYPGLTQWLSVKARRRS